VRIKTIVAYTEAHAKRVSAEFDNVRMFKTSSALRLFIRTCFSSFAAAAITE